MPFYEYQCARCGHHHEAMQKMADPHLKRCPACGKSALKRLVSAAAFRLKGAGWYETDFKKDSEDKRNLLAADKSDKPEKPDKADKTEAGEKTDKTGPAAPEAATTPAPEKPSTGPAAESGKTSTGASRPSARRTRGGRRAHSARARRPSRR